MKIYERFLVSTLRKFFSMVFFLSSILIMFLHGKYITLNSILSSEVTPPVVKIGLNIENNGDEATYNLQVRFKISEKEWLSKVYPKLEVNEKIEIESIEAFEPEKKGNYPIYAKVFFHDAAGYSFSSVLVSLLTYGEITRPRLQGKLEDLTISDRGTLKLHMTNLAYEDLKLDIHVLIPDELTIESSQKQVNMKARAKEDFKFRLSNLSALTDASYPLWIVVEYENENKHYTYLCSGSVSIKQKINIFEKYWWSFLILAAGLIFVFMVINLKKKATSRN